ncbi:MAG: DUF3267 domain-containing protein, partial [Ferruginibacter sp.]|nr:DUF3267 domain-containing protein [Cytophagales bacterium]
LLALAVVFGVLLPLHEGIHALVYKGMGAADIRFSFATKALAVYTCANRHVVHLREIIPLAIAPFLAISALLVVLAGYFPDYRLFFAWALVIHAVLCGGDFILIAYAVRNRNRDLYNYDDVALGKSYFFERRNPA